MSKNRAEQSSGQPQHREWSTEQASTTRGMFCSTLTVEDCSLVIKGGPHQGLQVPLHKEHIFVGREDWCDVSLCNDGQISSRHCEIRIQSDGIIVRDLGSRNGTYLEGHRILEAFLLPGNHLQIGQSVLFLDAHQKQRELPIHYSDASGLLIGKSAQMRKIFSILERLAQRDTPLLLTGETGTGKTSVAESLHRQSLRQKGPFVVVNCGALPPSLIEASLFGYERGAFTGAEKQHRGYLEQAHGGTLFLDEIGELPLEMQPKLLSVLESRSIQRLGGNQKIETDFRLITATHRNLVREIKESRFREDLFYRISVVLQEIPPLRERTEDIPLLIENFFKTLFPDQWLQLHPTTIQKLQQYLWPGNIRQLRNVLERTITFVDGSVIYPDDIDLPVYDNLSVSALGGTAADGFSVETEEEVALLPTRKPFSLSLLWDRHTTLQKVLDETERSAIAYALGQADGNVRRAAALLDISLPWIYKRIKKYGIKSE